MTSYTGFSSNPDGASSKQDALLAPPPLTAAVGRGVCKGVAALLRLIVAAAFSTATRAARSIARRVSNSALYHTHRVSARAMERENAHLGSKKCGRPWRNPVCPRPTSTPSIPLRSVTHTHIHTYTRTRTWTGCPRPRCTASIQLTHPLSQHARNLSHSDTHKQATRDSDLCLSLQSPIQ